MSGPEIPVGAYFYPFTATCPVVAERAAAIGYPLFDETEAVKHAQPRFPGHEQPRTFCLGDPGVTNWDNADPAAMATQIGLAEDMGLSFFVFDSYGGARDGKVRREYEPPIDTFIQSPRSSLRFAVMWCIEAPRILLPAPRPA